MGLQDRHQDFQQGALKGRTSEPAHKVDARSLGNVGKLKQIKSRQHPRCLEHRPSPRISDAARRYLNKVYRSGRFDVFHSSLPRGF